MLFRCPHMIAVACRAIADCRRFRRAVVTFACAVALTALIVPQSRADTITVSSPSLSAGYALAFGGLNHFDVGFPVTRDACRFQGSACAVSYQTSLQVKQFDNALGTLQQVDVRYVARSSFSARIQNRPGFGQPASSGTWTVGYNGALLSTIELAGIIANDGTLPGFAFAFPGDPIGLSGFSYILQPFNNSLGSTSISQTLGHGDVTSLMNSGFVGREVSRSFTDSATLAAFTGTGALSFNAAQHSQGRATSNSNSIYSINGVTTAGPSGSAPFINTFIHNFAPQVEVTYTFEAASTGAGGSGMASIPEAPGVTLLAVGLCALGWLRRRRRGPPPA